MKEKSTTPAHIYSEVVELLDALMYPKNDVIALHGMLQPRGDEFKYVNHVRVVHLFHRLPYKTHIGDIETVQRIQLKFSVAFVPPIVGITNSTAQCHIRLDTENGLSYLSNVCTVSVSEAMESATAMGVVIDDAWVAEQLREPLAGMLEAFDKTILDGDKQYEVFWS